MKPSADREFVFSWTGAAQGQLGKPGSRGGSVCVCVDMGGSVPTPPARRSTRGTAEAGALKTFCLECSSFSFSFVSLN